MHAAMFCDQFNPYPNGCVTMDAAVYIATYPMETLFFVLRMLGAAFPFAFIFFVFYLGWWFTNNSWKYRDYSR
jgi:hypothetical protein